MCLLLFVLPVSKKKIVDAGWVRVEFGQSGADGAPDFLGFGAFPWFSRFEVICKGGGAGLGTGFSAKSGRFFGFSASFLGFLGLR